MLSLLTAHVLDILYTEFRNNFVVMPLILFLIEFLLCQLDLALSQKNIDFE